MSVMKDDSMEVHYISSYRRHPDRSSCLGSSANCKWLKDLTDLWRFLPRILQNKNSVWPHLNCMDGSKFAFLNCTDGSVSAFLNCTNGSVLTYLNGSYGSVLSHHRFLPQSGLTRFPQSRISFVSWLLCKKSNKKLCLK